MFPAYRPPKHTEGKEALAAASGRLAPLSAEEYETATAVRDAFLQSNDLRQIHYPTNDHEEMIFEKACLGGRQSFINWLLKGQDVIASGKGWDENDPLSSNPLSYCRYQLAMLKESEVDEQNIARPVSISVAGGLGQEVRDDRKGRID
jgi:hypothetical protein